jgi:hypothetical protein
MPKPLETSDFSDSFLPSVAAEPLTAEEQALFLQKFAPLLAQQTALYTMDESTSVPEEVAQRLLASLCFTLGAHSDASLRALLAVPDWEEELARGRKRIEAHTLYGKALWQTLCRNLPPVTNEALIDTLKGIGAFFRLYDIRYFAADVPMPTLIDYPLSWPVPESYEGIAYINEYLRRLALENCLLHLFPSAALSRLMEASCAEWRDLPVSLYNAAADQLIGLALAGRGEAPGTNLSITESDRRRIADLLEGMPRPETLQALSKAADTVCRCPALKCEAQRRYLRRHAAALYPRLQAALPQRHLDGIFFSFSCK